MSCRDSSDMVIAAQIRAPVHRDPIDTVFETELRQPYAAQRDDLDRG